MQFFLIKGLTATASLWLDGQQGYAWFHRAAHILTNDDKQTATHVRHTYEQLLTEMEQAPVSSETLTKTGATFCKVTTSYWPDLFHLRERNEVKRSASTPTWVRIDRVMAALEQIGIKLSQRTCGRLLQLKRSLYGLPQPKDGTPRQKKNMPFKATFRDEYGSVAVRYIEEHRVPDGRGPIYLK